MHLKIYFAYHGQIGTNKTKTSDSQSPFMNKDIHKTMMTRTRLRNVFLKEPTPMNRQACQKQRNHCVSLMREIKKQYYCF